MKEGKELFVEHLRASRRIGLWKTRARIGSSLMGSTKDVTTLAKLEIVDRAGELPLVRSAILSRIEDHGRNRFLLTQEIDLDDAPIPGVPPRIGVDLHVWVPDEHRSRQFPVNAFMAFPGTTIRLMDHLLPIPSLVDDWTVTLAGAAGGPRCKVIEMRMHPVLPPPWNRLLTPDLRTVRLSVDATDLRLRRVEQSFGGGGVRTATVTSWEPVPDGTFTAGVLLGDPSRVGEWTEVEWVHTRPGEGTLTRLDLDNDSF